jgi:rhodanese-related sulfurtransferase
MVLRAEHGQARSTPTDPVGEVRALDPAQFALAARGPDTMVIDVRESDERRQTGSIAGAVHIPRGLLELSLDPSSPHHRPEVRPERPALVCCSDGQRSALAAATLLSHGHRHVAHLDGGISAWISAGMPLDGAVVTMTEADLFLAGDPRGGGPR